MRMMTRARAGALLVAGLGLLSVGCAARRVEVEVSWRQPPLIELEGGGLPAVGILQVHADEAPLRHAPPDVGNIPVLLLHAIKGYFDAQGSPEQVVDYTDLGFDVMSSPSRLQVVPEDADSGALMLGAWPGVPLGVTTPLVTVARVFRWGTGAAHSGASAEVIDIIVLLSTWTREGTPVRTALIEVKGWTGQRHVSLDSGDAQVPLYEELRAGRRAPLPDDWVDLLWALLHEAVALHYFPFLPHPRTERLTLVEDLPDAIQAVREARYEDALRAWSQRLEQAPTEPDALYNAAAMNVLLGEDRRALHLLARALQQADSPLYRGLRERVLRRRSLAQRLGAAPPESASRGATAEVPTRCFDVEREPIGDVRWARGLSPVMDEGILRDYHPLECDTPGVRCHIDSYQMQWFSGKWSSRFQPGLNDLDRLPNYDGTPRRRWAAFIDHVHRYRVCVYPVVGLGT